MQKQDTHIQFTHQIARHEYLRAVRAKDYATAMYWSLIWFETLGLFNIAADYCVNPWKGR